VGATPQSKLEPQQAKPYGEHPGSTSGDGSLPGNAKSMILPGMHEGRVIVVYFAKNTVIRATMLENNLELCGVRFV
jgi:hypothetical protein